MSMTLEDFFNQYRAARQADDDGLAAALVSSNPGLAATLADRMLAHARSIYESGDYDGSLGLFHIVRDLCRQVGERGNEGAALSYIGSIAETKGFVSEAAAYYTEALGIMKSLSRVEEAAGLLSNLGLLAAHAGDAAQALDYYQQALTTARQHRNRLLEAATLNNIARLYERGGNFPEAVRQMEAALALYKGLGNASGCSTVLNNIGMIHRATGNRAKALTNLQQALEYGRKAGNKENEAVATSNIGLVQGDGGDHRSAATSFATALGIARATGATGGELAILYHFVECLMRLEDYPQAMARCQERLALLKQIGDQEGQVQALAKLAEITRCSSQTRRR